MVVLSGFQDLSGEMFLCICVACGGLLFWVASVGHCTETQNLHVQLAPVVARLVGLDSPMLSVAQATQSTRLAVRWSLESLLVLVAV